MSGTCAKDIGALLQELWEKGEYTDISALNRALMNWNFWDMPDRTVRDISALLRIDKAFGKGV